MPRRPIFKGLELKENTNNNWKEGNKGIENKRSD